MEIFLQFQTSRCYLNCLKEYFFHFLDHGVTIHIQLDFLMCRF